MMEVIDAETARIIVAEVVSCASCLYCEEVVDKHGECQDVFYCAKMSEGSDVWEDEHIIPADVLKAETIWAKCQLPLFVCVTAEEVQE